jgi:hypothetical protein
MSEERRTILDEVELPPEREEVEIESITRAGSPLRIVCRRVEQVDALDATQTIPGAPPETAEEKAARKRMTPEQTAAYSLQVLRASLPYARPMICLGCGVILSDGSEQFPAFSPGGSVPGTIPVERIVDVEALKLLEGVMRCSGFNSLAERRLSKSGGDGSGSSGGSASGDARGEAGAATVSGVGVPGDAEAAATG